MKLLTLYIAMLGTVVSVFHSWHAHGLLVKAAMYSEGFNLTAHVKLRVADYYIRNGVMPSTNSDVDLPPAKSLFGTSVKRVAINRGGILNVDFEDRIGGRSMTFTPSVTPVSGLFDWTCTSDSIDPAVLAKLKPDCVYLPSTDAGKLMNAIANQDTEAVDSVLSTLASPDTVVNGNTPLMLAAKIGNTAIVEKLLQAGASIDNPALSSERRTPLMISITSNHPQVSTLLLSKGASVTRKDYRNMSAMEHAAVTDRRLGGHQFTLIVSARSNSQFAGIDTAVSPGVINEEAENERLQSLYSEHPDAAQYCQVKHLGSLFLDENELSSPEIVAGCSRRKSQLGNDQVASGS